MVLLPHSMPLASIAIHESSWEYHYMMSFLVEIQDVKVEGKGFNSLPLALGFSSTKAGINARSQFAASRVVFG